MKLNKILIAMGETRYGVLNAFSHQLAESFKRKGISVDVVDMNDPSINTNSVKKENYDLLFSFNAMITELFLDMITYRRNIPIWSFLVDHPIQLDTKLLDYKRYHIVSCVDKNHLKFVNEYYPNNQWSCFLPHGGSLSLNTNIFDNKTDVTLLGSLPVEIQNEFSEKFTQLNPSMQSMINRVIEKLYYNYDQCFEALLKDSFASYGLVVNDEEFRLLLEELSYIDTYVRFRKRLAIVETLTSHGIVLHVYGKGWDCVRSHNNLVIHDSVDYTNALKIIAQSKIVINSMPLFANGSHERIFDTMLQRTICFSDRSIFLEENFEDEKDLFYYSMNQLDDLAIKIKEVQSGQYNEQEILENAYQKASSYHTWDCRAQFIIDYMTQITRPDSFDTPYTNHIDCEFHELETFLSSTPSEMLCNKMKGTYFLTNKLYPDFTDSLSHSYNTYPFWGTWNPENNDFGIFEDRIQQLKDHWNDFSLLYAQLSDYTSKKILLNILKYWETMNPFYLKEIQETRFAHYFDLDIINITSNEVFVDLGAYNGDTLCSYMNTFSSTYNKIYCYELSEDNAAHLISLTQPYPNVIVRKCAVGNYNGYVRINSNPEDSSADCVIMDGSGSIPMVSLDENIREKITFLKADIEGSEFEAIQGTQNHIRNDHPKLAISVHHGNKDLWRIPKLINEIDPSYKLYLRYYGGNLYPNKIVLYAI